MNFGSGKLIRRFYSFAIHADHLLSVAISLWDLDYPLECIYLNGLKHHHTICFAISCVWCSSFVTKPYWSWFCIFQHCNCVTTVVFILLNQCLAKGLEEMFDHSELVGGTWKWAYPALCFSCGYFAYDQWDMLQYRLYSGLIPSILVHHLVLLVCFTLALYRNVTINYLILTLICEVRSTCVSLKVFPGFSLFFSGSMLTLISSSFIYNYLVGYKLHFHLHNIYLFKPKWPLLLRCVNRCTRSFCTWGS